MPSDTETRTFQFGPFRINAGDRLLLRDGQVIRLFPKTIDTLIALLSSNGRVLTNQELIKAVWGDIAIEGDNALNSNVSQLRKALEDDPKNPQYIETIPRRGYRWLAPVIEVSEAPTPAPTHQAPPAPIPPTPARRPKRVWIAIGVALLSVLGVSVYHWPPAPAIRSIVVVPLENLSRDPDLNYFAAGMTEALLTALGKIGSLKVIAYSTLTPAESAPGLTRIAQSVGADFALTGSVLYEGDRVRITVHLLHAQTRQQIWAEPYEGSLQDVLTLQSTVSTQVAEEVRVKLTPEDRARLAVSRQVNHAAYLDYLRGRFHWNRRTPNDFRQAMEYFQSAIKADPTWASPYAGLADVYLLLGSTSYDGLPPRDAMPKAKAAATAALKMDDSSAEAHTSLGYSLFAYDWDFPAAEREFRRALQLNPGYPTAHHWYAHYLLAMGKMDQALAEMREALERDPLSLAINTGMGWSFYLARRYDEAIEQYQKTLRMDESFVVAHCMLGMAYDQKKMYKEAVAEFERALVISPRSAFALAGLGQAYAASSARDQALRVAEQLVQLSQSQYVPSVYLAGIFAALGDTTQAFGFVGKAYDERSHYLIYLNVEPSLDHFRADPRYPELARRVGLSR